VKHYSYDQSPIAVVHLTETYHKTIENKKTDAGMTKVHIAH